ncbi:NAD(P)-dependent oxidoreductase, partial [Cribrihabitans sp. XS_ASV171]
MTDAVQDRARAEFDTDIRDSNAPMTRDEMIASLREYDIVLPSLGDAFSQEVFSATDEIRCGLLANFGVGYNHIDVAAARACGLAVTNTPGAVTDATADVAMTLLLMSARRAAEGERLVRSGRWEGWHPTQMLGLHVTGKHVGIVGMGRIGEAIARRCHFGFGMKVSYLARSAKDPGFPVYRAKDAASLAEEVDFLVV